MSDVRHQMDTSTDRTGYPRPQLMREEWQCLNGLWDFTFGSPTQTHLPDEVVWDRKILVPYVPECSASGIGDTSFHPVCWYRREFDAPTLEDGARLKLHFGAVDYAATVWLNGHKVGTHEGGYTPFSFDVTEALNATGNQVLVVLAEDDPADLTKPRGKQDWQLNPHAIWYPRMSGIWQTVWLEKVPKISIEHLRWTPNLQRWEVALDVVITDPQPNDFELQVILRVGGKVIAKDKYQCIGRDIARRIALADPGIDDYRNEFLWSPKRPTLIEAEILLRDGDGTLVDRVMSYTALRSIAVQGNKFFLNGRPLRLRFVLDQGVWPETGYTPPGEHAIKHDVELAKAMGFNGVRKHQKIEDPRYLYWADRLGLMVWEEMPSAYRFTRTAVERVVKEWIAVIDRDCGHPCIVTWVPFNESWGVPDLPNVAEHREYVQALYHLTKTIDPSRPVVGNDGWEAVATDIVTIHDYDENPERISRRYGHSEELPDLLNISLPAGRTISLVDDVQKQLPIMLTEFGGLSLSSAEGNWGYYHPKDANEFEMRYTKLLAAVRSSSTFAGFCYTQFSDTFQETNGLLTADRQPKFPLENIAAATTGPLETSSVYYEDGPPS